MALVSLGSADGFGWLSSGAWQDIPWLCFEPHLHAHVGPIVAASGNKKPDKSVKLIVHKTSKQTKAMQTLRWEALLLAQTQTERFWVIRLGAYTA